MKAKHFYLPASLIVFILQLALQPLNAQDDEYLIGFSQCTMDDIWRETMVREMNIQLTLHRDIDFIMRDAQNSTQKQIRDIKELVGRDIDLLIVSPNVSAPLTPAVEEVYQAGIPVIVIDRQIESDTYTAYIGANNYQIGKEAGNYIGNKLNGSGRIYEITGLMASSPAEKRHKGFVEGISQFGDIQVVRRNTGEWDRQQANKVMRQALKDSARFDLVFAHNDFMAIGAYEAAHEHHKADNFYFLGIDGLPTEKGGIQYVIEGKLDATLLYPTGGTKAIEVASNILHNKPFKRKNILKTVLIDSSNARIMQSQLSEILHLQDKIKQNKQLLYQQIEKYHSQRLLLIASLISLALLIMVVIVIYRANQQKIQANRKLLRQKAEIEKQNQEINKQHQNLKEVKNRLEEATQAKLRFFTNVSHEFRTPLTLILGPLETFLKKADTTSEEKRVYQQMYRNATRLLRLINQLMDFRKIEHGKMHLITEKMDINGFIKELKESFDPLAEKKHIHYRLITDLKRLYIWIDRDKLDKIIFNLISNAFKFTPERGVIFLMVKQVAHSFRFGTRQAVQIVVEDNGRGMSQEHVARIFDRFYQIEHEEQDFMPSTGLGLSLTQSLVSIHRGDIKVYSEKGKGSRFEVYLPVASDYLHDDEMTSMAEIKQNTEERQIRLAPAETDFTPDFSAEKQAVDDARPATDQHPVVLIVEDNADVRDYIRSILHNHYIIIEAVNGEKGLQKAERENPDLIIADVLMPVMDGLQMLKRIKSDVKTCHIPVIMLTAKASIEHKLHGLEEGADSYIPKPFNARHLQIRARKLIEGRQLIRKHFRETLSFEETKGSISRIDHQFLQKATKLVEENLHNDDFTVEYFGESLGLSRVHLYRKMKQLTGMSVTGFIRSVRLNKAIKLLKQGDMNVSEVAYEVGFSTPSYFTRSFKKQYNVSPKDFKEQGL